MKRLFASAAIVTIAAIGVPVATAATASAAKTDGLFKAWTQACEAVEGGQASIQNGNNPVCSVNDFGSASPVAAQICRAWWIGTGTGILISGNGQTECIPF